MADQASEAQIRDVIDKNFCGETQMFVEVATSFLTHLADQIKELEKARLAGNVDAVMLGAHRLKGEAAIFHLREPVDLMAKIETTARGGTLPDPGLLKQAVAAVYALEADLKAFVSAA